MCTISIGSFFCIFKINIVEEVYNFSKNFNAQENIHMIFEFGVSKAGFRITMSHLKQNLAQTPPLKKNKQKTLY